MEVLRAFFDTDGFMPHGMCLLWRPAVFWTHALSDALIAAAYFSIPVALVSFVRRRPDVAFSHVFYMFGAFILLCGATHAIEIWTLWNPDYGVEGVVKAATAAVSVATAATLWPLMPRVLALPSPAQLATANEALRREIAVRQQAEEALRMLNEELEQRAAMRAAALAARELTYRSVVQTALDAFALTDDAGRVLEWNPQAEKTFGWSESEAIGRPIASLIFRERDQRLLADRLAEFLAAGEHRSLRRRLEVTALRRDGSEFPAELIIVPIRLDGRWLFSAFARDVSDRVRAEDQLRQAQKMEAVGQLTGGLAHDFNNLLTASITGLDLLRGRVGDDAESLELIELALQANLRGADLTSQLLAFSRRQRLEAKAFDLNQLVVGTTGWLRRTLGEQIEIALDLAQELWAAFADPTQAEAALANLAINARDAMPAGGKLTIETSNERLDAHHPARDADVEAGDYVVLTVRDTGTGIPPELLGRVFEPFFSTKPEAKGSGLGLSMVYGFAKQSGGQVKIASEPGHGTVVRLYLPRASRAEVTPPAEVAGAAATTEGSLVVLVVEDNPDVRRSAISQLTALGHRTIAASDGEAALVLLERGEAVDVLFTDIVMPGMSGVALAARARRLRPGLPVLFTSGFSEEALASGDASAVAGRLLKKPYRMAELAERIREVMRTSTLARRRPTS